MGKKHMPMLSVRLPDEAMREIERRAARADRTESAYVRHILLAHLKKEGTNEKAVTLPNVTPHGA